MVKVNGMELGTVELQRFLERCWTIADMVEVFRVSKMTITNWRTQRGLPVIVIPGDDRPALRFVPAEVLAWAKANNVKTYGSTKKVA